MWWWWGGVGVARVERWRAARAGMDTRRCAAPRNEGSHRGARQGAAGQQWLSGRAVQRQAGACAQACLNDRVGPFSLPSAVWLNTTSRMTSMPRLWHSFTSCLNSLSTSWPPPAGRAGRRGRGRSMSRLTLHALLHGRTRSPSRGTANTKPAPALPRGATRLPAPPPPSTAPWGQRSRPWSSPRSCSGTPPRCPG